MKAIEADPNHEMYASNLGYLKLEQKKYEESEKWFLKALKIHPNYQRGLSNYVQLLDELGRYSESL